MQKENTLTVEQWCGRWFTANRHKWNGNTEGGYRNLIYSHILPSIGNMELSDLTEQTVTDFYDSLQSWGLSARSVWCVHLLLRRCMDEAAREQLIPYNPVRLCQEPKAEEYKTAPLRLGQLQRYLNAAEQLGVLPLIYIARRDFTRCVEQDMTNGIIAEAFEMDRDDLKRRRAQSVRNVRATNGTISLEKYARSRQEQDWDDDEWQD